MKLITGISAALLGTTLLAGTVMADPQDNNPAPHPHFSVYGRAHSSDTPERASATRSPQNIAPRANFNANASATTNADPGSWAAAHGAHVTTNGPNAPAGNANWNHSGNWNHNNNSGRNHGYWNSNNLHDHNVSHFNTQNRSAWQHGRWSHGNHHGHNGWWWNSGGSWFFYDQPVYPYPGYVSNTYYDDDYYDGGDDGYAGGYPDQYPGYGASPSDGGYYWYYCNNPAGYYPYVKSCRGPWRAVTPTPDNAQQGYDQNNGPDADDDDDRGTPPGYNDNGAQDRDQYNGPDNDGRGPPPGYNNDDRGPPPGYTGDNGPDNDEDGPPPR